MTKAEESSGRRLRHMHCLIITLSDRAASGVYADRSGPRICELLESFFSGHGIESTVEQCLLPDDAELLRDAILHGREQGVDVIITTGGTGVGPRDVAPDTVGPLCDKRIPGIMEHIRAKFGANNPRARLSRAIAGVAGTTQIYTLPGSVRAVEEYLPEILVTLEHIADILHGADTH
ncbi:MAG: molybdenum cofactor biosynthesis protein B [Thermoguttaceae bacterium]